MTQIENLKLKFLTFNLGGTESEEWATIFGTKDWNNLFTNDDTIWIICTQEDKRESKFMKALRSNVFNEENYSYHTKTPKHVYLGTFHVHLSVFVPNILDYPMKHLKSIYHPSYNIPDNPLQNYLKNSIYHKSSVVINIGGVMRVVGSHLPFNPHDEANSTMRDKALKEIVELTKSGNIPTFVLGDLNFRYINQKDQLTNFIINNKSNSFTITDITEDIPFTCKTVKTTSDKCNNLFLSKENENGNGNGNNTGCYNKARSKSKCDRVLAILPKNYKICNGTAYPLLLPPINKSDHNAVLASCTLTISTCNSQHDDKKSSGGGKQKVYVLGRDRIVTRVGKKYMVTYKSKKISLGEARRIEREKKLIML